MTADQVSFDLFPASGLDNSLFTAVLLGLLLLFLLTESFGWVFTGLVVPGYLASVFVIQPQAGAVIVLESVATYLAARAISDWAAPWAPWNRFFGRERFFLILLVSVAVRLAFESALLPAVGGALADAGWVAPTMVGNLFSVGLIVVPLTANMLWKAGLWRGAPQVVLPTVAITLALQLVLIPYTNLSISDFELSYENVALGFLHSPKTYIVLLTAAYLAMRNSLEWGWDSHGIVVLALVALAWLSPLKVLTTVVEVVLLVLVTRPLFSARWLRSANLEGPRRLVIVFVVGFTLKFVGCHLLAHRYPGLKATDYFGFGYLLPSLLALKVLQRGSLAVVLLPTLQTSLLALALGTGIGLSLALLQPPGGGATPVAIGEVGAAREAESIVRQAHRTTGRLLAAPPVRERRPQGEQLDAYRRLVHDLVVTHALGERDRTATAELLGVELVHTLDPTDGETFWLLAEPEGSSDRLAGWGLVVAREGASEPLVIEVPHPLAEPGTMVAGAKLFDALDASVLLVSGVDPEADREAGFGLGGRGDLPFAVARRALAGWPALEVRTGADGDASALWISRELPAALDLQVLREVTGEPELRFDPPPGADAYGTAPSPSRVRLQLSDGGLARALEAAYPPDPSRAATREHDGGLSGLASHPWFEGATAAWGHRPVTETELTLLEREVLVPLLARGSELRVDDRELRRVDASASLLGYGLERIVLGDGEVVLLLREDPPATRGWGSALVRPEAGTSRFLAVPRPTTEPGSLDLALHLLRLLDGRMLVIAVDPSGSPADVLDSGDPTNLFTMAHRVANRIASPGLPAVGLQVRGYGASHGVDDPVVISAGVLASDPATQLPDLYAVATLLEGTGVPVRWYDGGRDLAGLRGGGIAQLTVARHLDGQPYGVLWASTGLRRRLGASRPAALTQAAESSGLSPREVWLDELWRQREGDSSGRALSAGEPPADLGSPWHATLDSLVSLKASSNPLAVSDLFDRAREDDIQAEWLLDRETGRPVVWLRRGSTTIVADPASPETGGHGTLADPVGAVRLGQVALIRAGE